MPNLTGRVVKNRSADLREGEEIVRSLVGQPPGSKARKLNHIAEVAVTISSKDISGGQVLAWNEKIDNPLADRVPKQNVYLTITTQRLLVHTASGLGKPKDLAAEFELDDVANVRLDPTSRGKEAFVHYSDESITNIAMVSPQKPDEFVAAFEQVKGS